MTRSRSKRWLSGGVSTFAGARIRVVALGGAHRIGSFLEEVGSWIDGLRLAGLCDAGEAPVFRKALERSGLGSDLSREEMEQLGFYVCVADLEDELIRALGIAAVEEVVRANGDLQRFRKLQQMPAWRSRADSGTPGANGPLDEALGFLPKNAPVVAAIDTDADGDQWKRVDELLGKFPLVGGQLKQGAKQQLEEMGVDFDKDIKPLLGNDAVVGSPGLENGEPEHFVAAIKVKDEGKLDKLLDQQNVKQVGEKDGFKLYEDTEDGDYAARQGDVIAFSDTRETLEAAVEQRGQDDRLREDDFEKGLENLPEDALVRVSGDLQGILAASPEAAKARNVPWVAALRTYGLTLSAQDDGVALDAAVHTDPKELTPEDLPLASGEQAPPVAGNDGQFLIGIRDPAQIVQFAQSAAQVVDPSGYRDFELAKRQLGTKLGVDFDADVIGQFAGNAQVAVSPDGSFAARHPDRARALALYGGWARTLWAPDFPVGDRSEAHAQLIEEVRERWGDAGWLLRYWAPTYQHDVGVRAWWSRALRLGASPTSAVLWLEMLADVDVRDELPAITAPTLVLHRDGDVIVPVGNGRDLAKRIPGARYIELSGVDHLWWLGDQDDLLDPVEEFLTGGAVADAGEEVLATVLWIAGELPPRELERYGGRVVGWRDDGTLAAFESPTRALRCAEAAVAAGNAVRAGVHTGECRRLQDRLTGPAVERAAEIGAQAEPGEILASSIVAELVAGSGLGLAPRGDGDGVRVLASA